MDRRRFLTGLAMSASYVVFANKMPSWYTPLFAQENLFFQEKSSDLIILNDHPVNAETPPHLLDDEMTPASLLFVRNNGIPPENIDIDNWTLTIDGESVKKNLTIPLLDLKKNFKQYSYQITIECGGNGRSEFYPKTPGNQWTTGAVGSPLWTGVRVKDILDYVGIKKNAVYLAYYGADQHLLNKDKVPISRGVPIDKAMEDSSLIAWEINNKPLPLLNGYPLRLVFGGTPASTCGKWLTRISIRDKIHDGAKMNGYSYRIPKNPVIPGENVEKENMTIIEKMPIKSLITNPRSGITHNISNFLNCRGHAWGADGVASVDVSIDFGSTWIPCYLDPPRNQFAWQRWNAAISFPKMGYYEVWAKATDLRGKSQPMVIPGWNPKGYLNNACHRIAVGVIGNA